MLNKKSLTIFLLLISILVVSIGAVSATDSLLVDSNNNINTIEETVVNTVQDNTTLTDTLDSVSEATNDAQSSDTQSQSDSIIDDNAQTLNTAGETRQSPSLVQSSPILMLPAGTGSFTDLQNDLDSAGSTFTLTKNYQYDPSTDVDIYNAGGVVISNDIIIDGQGIYSIDGSFTYDEGTWTGVIDENSGSRIFYADSPVSITLKNLILKNGVSTPEAGDESGGALYFNGITDLTIQNCIFINNSVYNGYGGVMYLADTTATIENSQFIENYVLPDTASPSVIYTSDVVLNIKDTKFIDNGISSSSSTLFPASIDGVIYQIIDDGDSFSNISGSTFSNTNLPPVSSFTPGDNFISTGFIYAQNPIQVSDSSFNNGLAFTDDGAGAIYLTGAGNPAFHAANSYIDVPVTITNTNFTNIQSLGYTDPSTTDFVGGNNGVIYTEYSTTLTNDKFENIKAQGNAGVINSYAGDLTITDSTIKNVEAEGDGGAIYFTSQTYNPASHDLRLTKDTQLIIENTNIQDVTTNGNGGAILTNNNATIKNTNIENTKAKSGGAIYSQAGTLNITNSNLTNNKATDKGGAIYFNSWLVNDGARIDGAAPFDTAKANVPITVYQSILTNNDASVLGGAIATRSSELDVTHSVLYNNTLNYDSTVLGSNVALPLIATTSVSFNDNWFGTNDPSTALLTTYGSDMNAPTLLGTIIGASSYWTRYMVLNFTTDDNSTVFNGSTNTLVVTLNTVYDNVTKTYTPDSIGVPTRTVVFTSNVTGTFNPQTEDLDGTATATFNPSVSGVDGVLYATVDGESTTILVKNSTATNTTTTNGTDISIQVTASPNTVSLGNNVTYQIFVSNVGNETVGNVTVKLNLPSTGDYTKTNGMFDSVAGTWFIGELPVSQTEILTLTVLFNTTGVQTNTFNATCNETEINLTNNYAEVNVTVNPILDLIISANINNNNPTVDDNIIYTIILYNAGPNNAENTNVTVNLPTNFEYSSATPSAGSSYSNNTKLWTIGTLNAGNTVTLVVNGKVTSNATLAFSASATNTIADKNLSNNLVSINTAVHNVVYANNSDLGISLNRLNLVGNVATYRVTVVNNGPNPANNVIVTYALPTGLTFTGSSSTYNNNSNVYTWNLSTLNVGGSRNFLFYVTIDDEGQYLNTLTVLGTEVDSYPLNNTVYEILSYGQKLNYSDVGVEIGVSNNNPEFGDTLIVTITVTNNGPNNATDIVVSNVLSSGLTFVSSPDATYNAATGTWTINNLAPTGSSYLTLIATVSGYGLQNITVNAQPIQIDNITSNNTDTLSFYVDRNTTDVTVDLITTVTPSSTTSNIDDIVTFIVSVTNNGRDNATSVVLVNEIPGNIVFVSANGTYNSATGEWTVGTLNVGDTVEFELKVNTTTKGSYVINFTADSYEVDSDPTSNSANTLVVVNEAIKFGKFVITNITNTVGTNVSVPIVVLDSTGSAFPTGSVQVLLGSNTYTAAVTDGVATIDLTVPNTVGLHTATVTFTGSTGVNTTTFTVNATPIQTTQGVTVIADSVTDYINQNVTINVTVTNSTGGNVNKGNVSVTVNGVTYYANVTAGRAQLNVTLPATEGIYVELINYVSDDINGTGTVILVVLENATFGRFIVSNITNTIGTNVSVPIVVLDSTGTVINNGNINVTVGSDTYTAPVNNGVATIDLTVPNTVGLHTATVTYDGDTGINTTTFTINATPIPTQGINIQANPVNGIVNENVTVNVTVTDADGANVNNGTVSITINGNTYSANVNNGRAEVNITLPSTTGINVETVKYTGDVNATGTVILNVNPIPVNITAWESITTGIAGQTVNPVFNVTDINGNPVTDGTVSVTVNGTTYTAPVNAGVANVSVILPSNPQLYDAIAVYRNGAIENNVSIKLNATIPPVGRIVANNASGVINSNVTIQTVVFDINNNPVKNGTVSITVNGQTYTATVNNGIANVKVTVPSTVNNYPATVTYTGDYGTNSTNIVVEAVSGANETNITILDLGITIVANDTNPKVGEEFNFINANVPTGLDVLSTIPWTISTIAAGNSEVFNIVVRPTTLGTYITTVTVSSDELDNVTSNNTANAIVYVNVTNETGSADLGINVTRDKENVTFGDTITYILSVYNNGPDIANNVIVNASIPTGLTVLFTTGGFNPATNSWTISTINPGLGTTLTITGTIDGYGLFELNASVVGDEDDPDPTNNNDQDVMSVLNVTKYVDLEVSIDVNNNNPYVNETFIYVITVTNYGPDNATNVVVSDVLPIGLNLVSTTPGYNTTSSTWTINQLDAGESISLILSAKSANTGSFDNTVTVSADQTPNGTHDTTDNVIVLINETKPTTTEFLDLGVTLVRTNLTDGTILYTIRVTNNGPVNATNVVLAYDLPSGLSIVSSTRSYDPINKWFSFGNMVAGGGNTLTIRLRPDSEGVFLNTFKLSSSEIDVYSGNNTVSDVIVNNHVYKYADLGITVTVNDTNPEIYDLVTYTIYVVNNGPDNATNIVVTSLLPSTVTFVEAPGNTTYDNTTGKWTINNIAPSGYITLTLIGNVTDYGMLKYTVSVESDEIDNVTENNTDSVTVSVVEDLSTADLSITLVANETSVIIGQTVTYTINVTNNGPNNATNITVTYYLPSELTFLSTNVTNTGNSWFISSLNVNESTLIEFTVNTTTNGSFITNATVEGLEVDADPTNNAANTLLTVVDNITFGKFIVANITGIINTNVTVPIVVLDDHGNVLPDGTITVTLNGSTYTGNVTAGVANIELTIPQDMGLYTANVVYNGSTGINTTTFTVNATKGGSEVGVIINIDPINGTITETKNVNITVVDTEGNNLTGTITLTINGTTYTAPVNNGIATTTVTLPSTPGVTVGQVKFTNGTLNGTTNVPVIANPAPVIITALTNPTTGMVDEKVSILFSVKDTLGNNMTEGTVTINLNGTNYAGVVNNGIANVTFNLPDLVGVHNTTAVYLNGDLTNSTNITINITNVPVKEIIVNNVSKTINSVVTVPVVVLDANNNTVKEGTITIRVNNTRYTAPINGGVASVTIQVPGIVGLYPCNVSYTGPNGIINTTMFINATPEEANNGAIVSANNVVGTVGDTIPVNFTVTDIYGTNMPNGTVIMNIEGVDYTAIVNNGKAITFVTLPSRTGTFLAPLKYFGEELNGTGVAIVTVNPVPVTLTPWETPINGYEDETVNAIFDVKDIYGNDVTNGTVTINVEGTTYSADVNNGIANVTVKLPSPGEYNVTPTYKYENIIADTNITLNVSSRPVDKIIVGNVTDFINAVVNVPVVVVDTNGSLVHNGTITINLEGNTYTGNVNDGVAQVTITVPSTEGTYTADVTYTGDSGTKTTQMSVKALDYISEKTIVVGVDPIIGNISQEVTVPVTVTYNDGTKVQNGIVTLTIDGTDYTVNVTDGQANVTLTLPNTAGTYPVTVTYTNGTNTTTKNTTATVLDPTVITVLINAPDISGEVSTTQNAIITLTRSDSQPITDGTLTITVDGTTYTVDVTSGTTIIPITLPNTAGNYTANVNYTSDNLSAATTFIVEATAEPTNDTGIAIIGINPIMGYEGEEVIVPAIIYDEVGNLLNNGTLTININGVPYTADVLGGIAYVPVQIPQLPTMAIVTYDNGEVSNTTVTQVVVITSDDKYADIGVEVTVDNDQPYVGNLVTYTINLYNNGPDAAHNITIKEVIPSGLLVINYTGNYSEGWFIDELASGESTNLTFTCEVLSSGAISVITTANASEIDLNTSNNRAVTNIVAQPSPMQNVDTILVLYNLTETYGEGEYEVGTLTDIYGNPIVGQHIAMNLTRLSNGQSKIYWATTDYLGHVMLQINLAPGNYTSKAYFDGVTMGNTTYNPSESETARIIVNAPAKIPTITSLNNYTGVYHFSDYLTGVLTDINGTPLSGQIVGLNMTRLRTGENKIYWVMTESNGVFRLLIQLRNDDYIGNAIYQGTDVYLASQSEFANLNITLAR